MIAPLLLATLLSAGDPAPDPASAPAAEVTAAPVRADVMDERITIRLRDASAKDTVEKLALLLGATPILGPGVDGTISVVAENVPVSDVIRAIEKAGNVSIRLVGNRLFVTVPGTKPPEEKADFEAVDRVLLADTALPRRPVSFVPRRPTSVFEFRAVDRGGEAALFDFSGGTPSRVMAPGCLPPGLDVFLLPPDPFDGSSRLAFLEWNRPKSTEAVPDRARIVTVPADGTPTGPVGPFLPCASRFEIREGVSGRPAARETRRYAGQFLFTLAVIEVGPEGERVLSSPRIQTPEGIQATTKTGSQHPSPSGTLLEDQTTLAVEVLRSGEEEAIVAVVGTVTRDVEPSRGAEPLRVRVGNVAETLRMKYGEAQTVPLSSVYGAGRSALVLTVSVEKMRPRAPAR